MIFPGAVIRHAGSLEVVIVTEDQSFPPGTEWLSGEDVIFAQRYEGGQRYPFYRVTMEAFTP